MSRACAPPAMTSMRLADALIQSFLRHTLRDGFFHADMHPGNLFVDRGKATSSRSTWALSAGSARRSGAFSPKSSTASSRRDYLRVAEVHFEAGYVPGHHHRGSFAQAIRAPSANRSTASRPRPFRWRKLLTLLFEVTELFDMETRPELVMLQKTMVVVEGVARMLNPRFNMWKAIRTGRRRLDPHQSRTETHRRRPAGRAEGRGQTCRSGPRNRRQDREISPRTPCT